MMILFQDRFFPLVCAGGKRQTIRAPRKDGKLPKPGELLHTGRWTGKPYRSKVERGPVVICKGTEPLLMEKLGVRKGIHWLSGPQIGGLARADGFEDAEKMLAWFEGTHGLPFEGWLYEWHWPAARFLPGQQVRAGDGARLWVREVHWSEERGEPVYFLSERRTGKHGIFEAATAGALEGAEDQAPRVAAAL